MTILPMILFVYLVVFRVSVYFRMGNQFYGVSCLTLELFNILTRFFAVRGSNWEGAQTYAENENETVTAPGTVLVLVDYRHCTGTVIVP